MKDVLTRFWRDESGQALSEYALILALIAGVVVIAVGAFGDQITATFQSLTEALGTNGAGE